MMLMLSIMYLSKKTIVGCFTEYECCKNHRDPRNWVSCKEVKAVLVTYVNLVSYHIIVL